MMMMMLVDSRNSSSTSIVGEQGCHSNTLKAMIKTALRGATVLLLGTGAVNAQQQIDLSAAPSTLALQ